MTVCDRCRDTGFEIVDREGREFAQLCSCRRAAVSGDDFLNTCRIPPRYEHCTLASFEAGNPSLVTALEKSMMFCTNYPHLGDYEGLGLLFLGENGLGKTHLAVSVLRELVTTKGARGQFWDFNELIREIRRSYDLDTRTTEVQVLQPVVEADILLLDDLGAWKMTDWMMDTLFYILNSRYMSKRATLVTTNFQDADKEQLKDADPTTRKEFLVERVGSKTRSRLMEMCFVIRMEGPDFRCVRQSSRRVAFGDGVRDPKVSIPPPKPRFGG